MTWLSKQHHNKNKNVPHFLGIINRHCFSGCPLGGRADPPPSPAFLHGKRPRHKQQFFVERLQIIDIRVLYGGQAAG